MLYLTPQRGDKANQPPVKTELLLQLSRREVSVGAASSSVQFDLHQVRPNRTTFCCWQRRRACQSVGLQRTRLRENSVQVIVPKKKPFPKHKLRLADLCECLFLQAATSFQTIEPKQSLHNQRESDQCELQFARLCFCRLDWQIRTLSFSADGNLLAAGSEDLLIDIADVHTGQIWFRRC